MNQRAVIAICPQSLAKDARTFEGVLNPVTVDHSPWACDRCGADCWIGPKQKLLAALGQAEAVCYLCIFADPELKAAVTGQSMVSLNPTIDERPRRF